LGTGAASFKRLLGGAVWQFESSEVPRIDLLDPPIADCCGARFLRDILNSLDLRKLWPILIGHVVAFNASKSAIVNMKHAVRGRITPMEVDVDVAELEMAESRNPKCSGDSEIGE